MDFRRDDYVQLVAPNGNYRFGFIQEMSEEGAHIMVCLHEEGESKIAWDKASAISRGIAPADYEQDLSPDDKRILAMVGDGQTSVKIAAIMGRSPSTIRNRTRSLRLKLNLDSQDQLIIFAQGLLADRREKR